MEYMFMDVERAEEDATWNMENNEMGLADIPRATKFLLLPMFEENEPGHIPMGFGVGHFKGGTKLSHSELYDQYEWYLLGTIPYFIHVYLQLGVAGILWYIAYLISIFVRHPKGYSKRDLNMQLFLLLLIGINFFYIESMRDLFFCLVLYALIAMSWLPDKRTGIDEQSITTIGQASLVE
jgi:hypothetical protein